MSKNKKIVLITGASAGIGKDAAKSLILQSDKYIVYCGARRVHLMKDLEELGATILKLDVSNKESIDECIKKIIKKNKTIDILINNAGFGVFGPIEYVDLNLARYQYEVNVFGAAYLMQKVIPYMRKQNYGKILNVSSIVGKFGTPLQTWYCSSKYALEGISDCARLELKRFNIDVIVIEPGGIKTDFVMNFNGQERSFKKSNDNKSIIKKNYDKKYQVLLESYEKRINSFDSSMSHPKVITKIINKALNAKNPKPRYWAGLGAKPIFTLRKIFSDRMFYKILDMFFR